MKKCRKIAGNWSTKNSLKDCNGQKIIAKMHQSMFNAHLLLHACINRSKIEVVIMLHVLHLFEVILHCVMLILIQYILVFFLHGRLPSSELPTLNVKQNFYLVFTCNVLTSLIGWNKRSKATLLPYFNTKKVRLQLSRESLSQLPI